MRAKSFLMPYYTETIFLRDFSSLKIVSCNAFRDTIVITVMVTGEGTPLERIKGSVCSSYLRFGPGGRREGELPYKSGRGARRTF